MIPSKQAKVMLEEVTQKHPERWVATVNTLIVEILDGLEDNIDTTEKIKNALIKLVTGKKAPQAQPTPEAADASPAEEMPSVGRPVETEVDSQGERVGADGSVLSPQEAALEAQMDAAVNAVEVEKQGGAPQRAPQPRRGNLAPVRGPQPPADQASIEAQMDAAIGAMDKR